MATVQGGKDPWLFRIMLSASLVPNFELPTKLRVVAKLDRCMDAYLGRVKVDALYTFAPGA